MGRVLVVAFDGLDRENIEEYGLENVTQEEFGAIDNSTGIKSIKTAELFASFLTGKTHEEHGIVGLKKEDRGGEPVFDRLLHSVPQGIKDSVNTSRTQSLLERFRPGSTFYTREDLEAETLFDKIDSSRDVNVPVYSRNTFIHRKYVGFELGFGKDAVRRDLEAEHSQRRKETFEALEGGEDFIMSHFFYPDTFQHLYPNAEGKIEDMYRRMDELAGEISDAAEGEFDKIVFMSDHGLPTKNAHNENAFYSCNQELGLGTPGIRDFHDLVLEWTVGKEVAELEV